MASYDDVLMQNMRGFRKETGQPLDEPALRAQVASDTDRDRDLRMLNDQYSDLQVSQRSKYRGFEVPLGMDEDQADRWFASIDAREDERERREAESFLTRTPEPYESQFFQQLKDLNIAASQEERRFLRDPAGRAEVYKDFAGDVYEDVMAGDPETIRNVADVTSLTDPTGVSDVVSATQSGRLAVSDPEMRTSHLLDTAISGTAGLIQLAAAPLVGSLLSGAALKRAIRGDAADLSRAEDAADVADDVSDAARASRVSGAGVRRLFHASPADIDEFRPSLTGRYGSGVYMSASPDEGFARAAKGVLDEAPDSGNVYTLDVDLKNPLAYDDKISDISADQRQALIDSINKNGGEGESFLGQLGPDANLGDLYSRMLGTAGNPGARPNRGQARSAQQVLKDAGYDGIIAPGGSEFIAFDPSAIKIVSKDRVGDAAKAVPDVPAPVFESEIEKVVTQKAPKKLGVDDVEKFLSGKGAKKSEIVDTKIPEFIENAKAAGKKSVTKDELIQHLDDNKVQIEEVRLDTREVPEVPIPDNIRRLENKKLQIRLDLDPVVVFTSNKLAPENPTSLQFGFHQNPEIFLKAYSIYIDDLFKVRQHNNVPEDLTDIVDRLEDLNDKGPENWTLDDAGFIDTARKAIRAKIKDPNWNDITDDAYRAFEKNPDAPQFRDRRDTRNVLEQEQNLYALEAILNRMPEAESRLAALRRLEGQEKYREYVEAFNTHAEALKEFRLANKPNRTPSYDEFSVPGGDNYQEILLTVPVEDMSKAFRQSHHKDIPNVMVHIRTKDRVDSKGRRILFVEEIQSDWHQNGRKRGYTETENKEKLEKAKSKLKKLEKERNEIAEIDGLDSPKLDEANEKVAKQARLVGAIRQGPVPEAPLKDIKEWTALSIKRIFREAAEGGYDGVAFTRSDMITPLVAMGLTDARDIIRSGNPADEIEAMLRVMDRSDSDPIQKIFDGNKYFYDKLIPSIAKKESKAKQGTTLIELEDLGFSRIRSNDVFSRPTELQLAEATENNRAIEVPFFELTDKVKDRVIKPQKLYSVALPGIAVGAAAAEEEELSAAAALGAIGLGGMALYRGAKGARAADRVADAPKPPAAATKLPETPDEINKAFNELASHQRYLPEEAMLDLTRLTGGVGSFYADLAEHIGDLTHRMSEYGGRMAYAMPKIERYHRRLHNPYGFEKEMLEVAESNFNYAKKRAADGSTDDWTLQGAKYESFDDAMAHLKSLGQTYADEHRKLPVYNEVQRLANDAAIAVGEFRFDDAREILTTLKKYADEGEDAFKARQLRVEPEFARFGSPPDDIAAVSRELGVDSFVAKPPAAAMKLPETQQEIDAAFRNMGQIQRAGPENQMVQVRHRDGIQGPISSLVENVGDLTHRMGDLAFGPVKGKVNKTYNYIHVFDGTGNYVPGLNSVTNDADYHKVLIDEGYRRHVMSAEAPNSTTRLKSREKFVRDLEEQMDLYAQEHRTVPVYNEAQRLANDAAIAVGERRYVDAKDSLGKLNKYLDEGEEAFRARMGRVEPEFARPGSAPAADAATAGAKTVDEAEEAARLWREKGVESPYFKRWFGESKVVDEAGEPLAVYHAGYFDELDDSIPIIKDEGMHFGTKAASDIRRGTKESDDMIRGARYEKAADEDGNLRWWWSTDDGMESFDFDHRGFDSVEDAKRHLQELAVSMREFSDTELPLTTAYLSIKNPKRVVDQGDDWTDAVAKAKAEGHDGIVYRNEYEDRGSTSYIVFEPTQVKSVNNPGTFNPTDPSILKGIGVGAAVPAAAAVRSQRQEEEGNPLSEPKPYAAMDMSSGFEQPINFSEVENLVNDVVQTNSEFLDLYTVMGLIEAEYASLSDDEKKGDRGRVLNEWYDSSINTYEQLGEKLENMEYERFLMGEDVYNDTNPNGIQQFDDTRMFENTGNTGTFVRMDPEIRKLQEDAQRSKLKVTMENGGPMIDLFGPMGNLNRYILKKAEFFKHPIQTVQIDDHQKRLLKTDFDNIESLNDSGLISYLLYKELLGNVRLS